MEVTCDVKFYVGASFIEICLWYKCGDHSPYSHRSWRWPRQRMGTQLFNYSKCQNPHKPADQTLLHFSRTSHSCSCRASCLSLRKLQQLRAWSWMSQSCYRAAYTTFTLKAFQRDNDTILRVTYVSSRVCTNCNHEPIPPTENHITLTGNDALCRASGQLSARWSKSNRVLSERCAGRCCCCWGQGQSSHRRRRRIRIWKFLMHKWHWWWWWWSCRWRTYSVSRPTWLSMM